MDVKRFWESPEAVEYNRRDHILKELEIREIAKHVRDGMRVLDMGCGSGETAIELVRQFDISVLGIDYSPVMVEAAKSANLTMGKRRGNALFVEYNALSDRFTQEGLERVYPDSEIWQQYIPPYDLAYTERFLINLPNWSVQRKAICNILGLLKPGGLLVMIEHAKEGLEALNEYRVMVRLDTIRMPGHNRYFREAEMDRLLDELIDEGQIELYPDRVPLRFASTYYLLSRVVNAVHAKIDGKEPDYHAPVNHLALILPNIGNIGHAVKWVWRKAG